MIRVVSWWEDEATTFFVSPLRDFLRANDGSDEIIGRARRVLSILGA